MREERHDGHERERRMQPAPVEREPRHEAGADYVRPETRGSPPPQSPRDSQRNRKNAKELKRSDGSGRVKQGDDDQPDRVIRNREQQEKRNRWMSGAENPACNEIAEGDIGRRWNGPAARKVWKAERVHERQIDHCRSRHASNRGDERQRGPARRVQRALWRRCLDDFFGGERKEERHPDAVDDELKGMCEPLVAFVSDIGPRQSRDRADYEQACVIDELAEQTLRIIEDS